MLFRLTRSTCWYRQKPLSITCFRFGSQKNGKSDKTESIPKNDPVIKTDGINQNQNVESQKGNNLQKMNQERQHPNGAESNMIPVSAISQLLKHQREQQERSDKKRKEQQERQDKKRKEQQERSDKKTNKIFYLGVSTLVGTVIFGVSEVYFNWWTKSLQKIKQKHLINQYGQVNPDMSQMDDWLFKIKSPSNYTKQKFKQFLVDFKGATRLQIVTGQPGNGKTTQLKRLIRQLREQGHIVYYHNVRLNQQDSSNISELFKILSIFFNKDYMPSQEGKLVYLILDDINLIERSEKDPQLQQRVMKFWTSLSCVSGMKTHRALVVSSSSAYFQALRQKSYVEKESFFHILKNKPQEEMKQSIKNIFNFCLQGKKVSSDHFEQTINYLLQQKYTLREVMKITLPLKTQTVIPDDKKFLDSLIIEEQQSIQNECDKKGKRLTHILSNMGQQQKLYCKGMLQEIIKLGQLDGQNGCLQVQKQLKKMKNQKFLVQGDQTFEDVLEEYNLVFYCYPRTEKSRKIIQGILAKMQ